MMLILKCHVFLKHIHALAEDSYNKFCKLRLINIWTFQCIKKWKVDGHPEERGHYLNFMHFNRKKWLSCPSFLQSNDFQA